MPIYLLGLGWFQRVCTQKKFLAWLNICVVPWLPPARIVKGLQLLQVLDLQANNRVTSTGIQQDK